MPSNSTSKRQAALGLLVSQATEADFAVIGHLLLCGKIADLLKMAKSGPPLQRRIAVALISGFRQGRFGALDLVLDRIIGPTR